MIPVFDLHADVLMDLVRRREAGGAKDGPADRVDTLELEARHLGRMRAGGVVGAVLTDCRMAGEAAAPEHLERFIEAVRRELGTAGPGTGEGAPAGRPAPPSLVHVRSAADLGRAFSIGAFAAIVGYEGLSAAGGETGWIRRLHREAGLRVAALTHNDDNAFGGGALGDRGGLPVAEALGLTEKGREAVALMNELGVLIDLSHAGRAARRDILRASTRPVMLSHTSAKAVHDTGRNLGDEELRALADRGGLVGCMTSPAAIAPIGDREHRTLERYIAHLRRMIDAAGVDHVGLGLHFCEYLYTPEEYPPVAGLEDASRAQAIPEALLASGFSTDEVERIAWRNFARIFAEAVG